MPVLLQLISRLNKSPSKICFEKYLYRDLRTIKLSSVLYPEITVYSGFQSREKIYLWVESVTMSTLCFFIRYRVLPV